MSGDTNAWQWYINIVTIINVREYRTNNQKLIIQKNWQHSVLITNNPAMN